MVELLIRNPMLKGMSLEIIKLETTRPVQKSVEDGLDKTTFLDRGGPMLWPGVTLAPP